MGFGKPLLMMSLIVIVIGIYFHLFGDKEAFKECIFSLLVKVSDTILILDDWLSYNNYTRLQRTMENISFKYMLSSVNTSGLIIGLRRFDGVEVIVFDLLHSDRKRPAILYIHGGGWSSMNPSLYSHITADLARRLNTLVISIDYRKAPEHTYPAAFDDVLTAVKYFFTNAALFDVDPDRVAIMGDSAGGNLAIAVTYHLSAMRQHNKHTHTAKLLVPLCPSTQMADTMLPSFQDNVNDIVLSKKKLIRFFCYYVFGVMSGSDLSECIETVSTNGHINDTTALVVATNMDWTKYLIGHGYETHSKTHFHYKDNRFASRLSLLVLDPHFSPLSALNDSQLTLLPPMIVFGASKDPLRDDAKLLVARASAVGNIVSYTEIDFHHDPFLLSSFGFSQALKSLDLLVAALKNETLL